MEFSELSPKRRKVEPSDDIKPLFVNDCKVPQNLKEEVCVTIANSTTNHRDITINTLLLSRFLQRLKLRTIPLISPLLDRLQEAENKNITALKSIDKINKRIKELEFHVEKSIKTVPKSHSANGTDITDQHSDEYRRIMNALQSSPFTPFKPSTSQACKQIDPNDFHNSNILKQSAMQAQKFGPHSKNGHTIDLTNKQNGTIHQMPFNSNLHKTSPVNLDILSAQYLPISTVTNLMSSPHLTWCLVRDGIFLQWDLQFIDPSISPIRYEISSFQKSEISHSHYPWRKIGEVAALPLPMACTLTYVAKLNTYFFAVRAWVQEDVASAWSNVIMVDIN